MQLSAPNASPGTTATCSCDVRAGVNGQRSTVNGGRGGRRKQPGGTAPIGTQAAALQQPWSGSQPVGDGVRCATFKALCSAGLRYYSTHVRLLYKVAAEGVRVRHVPKALRVRPRPEEGAHLGQHVEGTAGLRQVDARDGAQPGGHVVLGAQGGVRGAGATINENTRTKGCLLLLGRKALKDMGAGRT